MKNIIFIYLFLFVSTLNSQTVVIDEKFKENNYPVDYNFLPNLNRLVIQKGELSKDIPNKIIKNIYSYGTDGSFEIIVENDKLASCVFSPIENTLIVSNLPNANEKPTQFRKIVNGKSTSFTKTNDFYQYFNDEYEISLLNQNNKSNINIEKDSISFSLTNIVTRINEKVAIKKPDVTRIINPTNTNYANGVDFAVRINEYSIGIITKAIAKDYKSATLYRTIYAYNGVVLNDIAYKVEFQYKNLMYSNNGGGYIYTNPQTGDTYLSDLTINNFVIDQKTEDVYVYGLFAKNAKSSSNISNEPLGFYIFKFDKSGNKIWESVQTINDKADLNTNQNIANIKLNVTIRNEKVLLSISSASEKKNYIHYAIVDKATGNIAKIKKLKFSISNENKIDSNSKFVNSYYNNIGYEKKGLDIDGLIAQDDNLLFSNYLSAIQNNQKLFFKTFYSRNGIWLLETDNTGYFKVTFFKE